MSKENICGLDAKALKELETKHGCVVVVDVDTSKGKYNVIFKEPDFDILEATGALGKNNEMKATKALYENCVLYADEPIQKRDLLKLKALEGLTKHIQGIEGNVKNI